eukprot:2965405-Amphidinium_carterae.1
MFDNIVVWCHDEDKLQCQGFSSYLSRFSYVYFGSGLVPETIYQLREVQRRASKVITLPPTPQSALLF